MVCFCIGLRGFSLHAGRPHRDRRCQPASVVVASGINAAAGSGKVFSNLYQRRGLRTLFAALTVCCLAGHAAACLPRSRTASRSQSAHSTHDRLAAILPSASKVNGNGVYPSMQRALARRHACPFLPSLRRTVEQQHQQHHPPLSHLHQLHCSLIAVILLETPCIDIALGRLRVLACLLQPVFFSPLPAAATFLQTPETAPQISSSVSWSSENEWRSSPGCSHCISNSSSHCLERSCSHCVETYTTASVCTHRDSAKSTPSVAAYQTQLALSQSSTAEVIRAQTLFTLA